MKIEKFWVVTHATPESEFLDVCFQADIRQLGLQFRGGLDHTDIVGIYTLKSEAVYAAKQELLLAANSK